MVLCSLLLSTLAYPSEEDLQFLYRATTKLITKYEELKGRVEELEKRVKGLEEREKKREEVSLREYGVVRASKVNLRTKPAKDGKSLAMLSFNEEVEILEDLGEWLKVKTKEGYVGYVASAYVLKVRIRP